MNTYVVRTYIVHRYYYIDYMSQGACDMARYFTSRCPYFHEPQASEHIAWE
jgi:hypothetical protein